MNRFIGALWLHGALWALSYWRSVPQIMAPAVPGLVWFLLTTIAVLAPIAASWLWITRAPHPSWERARRLTAPRAKSARVVTRLGDASRRKHGLASWRDVRCHGSRRPVRQLATTVRPSLDGRAAPARVRMRTREVAIELCRVGLQKLWASIEDVVLVFGGPRTGKTGWLAGRILDAPGPVVVTSTRVDLYDQTRAHRAAGTWGGRPVYVFNAAGVANLTSTITWDPLTGCRDPQVPAERVADMIPKATGERESWAELARAALAALMHAAALGGHDMATVRSWVADPAKHKAAIVQLLRAAPEQAYLEEARQFLECNDRTRSSITTSIMPALAWLNSPAARQAAAGGHAFDVAELIAARGTVYILGADPVQVGALMAGLAGYIAREARRIAATMPGGRLDPPLTLALDEAAAIAPPLPDWTSDMGGAGIPIIACFQSRAQMIRRWGEEGAAVILNNAGSVMLYGGTKDPDDLEAWASLFGKRDEATPTYGADGELKSESVRQVPVLAPAQLANMPRGRVAVLRRGMPPAIGRTRLVWHRWDVRLANLQAWLEAWRSERAAAAAAAAGAGEPRPWRSAGDPAGDAGAAG